ncbi:MAG: ABC-F family ATP-binding cassette domain-containing protein [Firmicutes bacterium]|nr:ABC-F family ATP-binding cassette domain-containing protein [Bacillota bacterium]
MTIVNLDGVRMSFGSRVLIEAASFSVQPGEKIGLIGRNGTGKSTLLRVLAGLEPVDGGELSRANSLRVGYLSQEMDVSGGRTVSGYAEEAFASLRVLAGKLREAEEQMANPEVYNSPGMLAAVMERYERLSGEYERAGGYDYQTRARMALTGLGFAESEFTQPVETLSGGQRVRVALARLLLEEPDFLLLDEPTNHLDMQATEWLEEYLRSFGGAMVAVSHDRYFLDAVADRILEIENRRAVFYRGNYSFYAAQKAARIQQQEKEYERQQEEIRRMEFFIARFGAGTRSTLAKSREKMLERMELVERPNGEGPAARFRFSPAQKSSREVVALRDVSKAFGDREIFSGLDLEIRRGDRLGIVGSNGSGKTTLLRIILGEEAASSGEVHYGEGVTAGYFSQAIDDLDPANTVLEELLAVKNLPLGEARSLLARFLFRGEEVFKEVRVLSGGERNRLMLAKLLVAQPNLLVLDEPTNHLDIEARRSLEEALADYPGTCILVSHDRYFLDRLANRMLMIAGGKVAEYAGNYSAMRAAQAQRPQTSPEAVRQGALAKQARKREAAPGVPSEREIAALEVEIARIEEKLAGLLKEMTCPELYANRQRLQEVLEEHKALTSRREALYGQWESLASREDH